jgi:hypothetical protein
MSKRGILFSTILYVMDLESAVTGPRVPGLPGGRTEPAPAPEPARWPNRRLDREWRTVAAMVVCYCGDKHGRRGELCAECRGLMDYAALRLDRCQFGAEKPTCVKCPVHCYQRDRREQMRAVMRYAGPRMLWLHPILCLRHWLDGLRETPAIRTRKTAPARK